MSASAASADVQARGTGLEARGAQKVGLSSRLVPLDWLPSDFVTNHQGVEQRSETVLPSIPRAPYFRGTSFWSVAVRGARYPFS